jgi:uncharacterized membrane protein
MLLRRMLKPLSAAVIFAFMVSGLMPAAAPASAQGSGPTILTNWTFVYQGSSDFNAGLGASDSDFGTLKIMSFDLPYDASRVYTVLPTNAYNITVWSGAVALDSSQYGTETSGAYSGKFYIDVPSSFSRNSTFSNSTASAASFSASDSVYVNTSYADSAVRLVNDSPSGQFISGNMSITSAYQILSANLTFNGTSTANITSYLSDDGGSTWWQCQNSTPLTMPANGTSMRVRFDMTGNSTLGFDTSISSYWLTVTYTALSTVYSVHISYQWSQTFKDGSTTVDFSEALPYSAKGTSLLMIYVVSGYSVKGNNMDLIFDENRTMNPDVGKDLYFNESSPNGTTTAYSIDVIAPSTSSEWAMYVVAVVLMAAFASAFAYARMRKPAKRAPAPTKPTAAEPDDSRAADEERRKMLVEKKKEMLSEIEDIKGKMASGALTRTAAEADLQRLKKEFKSVRNELNRLSKRSASEGDGEGEAHDLESVLAALARVDADFEKGRLPESTYKTIRKDYVDRAAQLMAASKKPPSPFEAEKAKLTEAIVALDEEREKGEIDERVYADLRASYRKQLAELLKKENEQQK